MRGSSKKSLRWSILHGSWIFNLVYAKNIDSLQALAYQESCKQKTAVWSCSTVRTRPYTIHMLKERNSVFIHTYLYTLSWNSDRQNRPFKSIPYVNESRWSSAGIFFSWIAGCKAYFFSTPAPQNLCAVKNAPSSYYRRFRTDLVTSTHSPTCSRSKDQKKWNCNLFATRMLNQRSLSRFSFTENIAGQTQLKSSVQRGIRGKIIEQYPSLEPILDDLMPKKTPIVLVKGYVDIHRIPIWFWKSVIPGMVTNLEILPQTRTSLVFVSEQPSSLFPTFWWPILSNSQVIA